MIRHCVIIVVHQNPGMNKNDIYAVISRYLTKTTIDEDEEHLKSWISEKEENKSLIEHMVNHWNSPGDRRFSILKSEEIKKEIWNKANQKQTFSLGAAKRKSTFAFLRYAAVFLIFIGSISVIYFQLYKESSKQSIYRLISKSNSAGRKSTIHLNDGSVVFLNSESEISYREIFSDTARIIWLTGEAFFEVAHDATKPFYVISQNLKIKALGTSFNVSGYSDADAVKVSLSTGKVLVNKFDSLIGDDESVVIELIPGQEVSFQKSTNIFSPVSTYDVVEAEGWKDGVLYFKHAKLNEIVKKLERWYGVKIEINKPSKEVSYTGLFERQNLENVLHSIGFVANFDFKINADKVLLNFKNEKYE